MCVMVCPFAAPQPFSNFSNFRKVIKCDRCKGRDKPYCVESCPTRALALIDSAELAIRETSVKGEVKLMGLDFVLEDGLLKPGFSHNQADTERVSGKERASDERDP